MWTSPPRRRCRTRKIGRFARKSPADCVETGESRIAFNACNPLRRELPVEADIGARPKGRPIKWLAGGEPGQIHKNAVDRHRCRRHIGARRPKTEAEPGVEAGPG